MIRHNLLKYDLQFFAEEDTEDTEELESAECHYREISLNEDKAELNIEALAGIISEQDKRIQQLEQDNSNLKKTNAQLLVRVSAGGSVTEQKGFDENLLDLVGFKPRKE